MRLLCKHFGFTSRYVNEDMPVLPDWYCCISVALDAEEDEAWIAQRNAYMAAGGDLKKFPKKPSRHTTQLAQQAEPRNPLDIVMDAMKGAKIPRVKGSIDEVARARGLPKVFKREDGTFVDSAGNPVEVPPGSVFVESS